MSVVLHFLSVQRVGAFWANGCVAPGGRAALGTEALMWLEMA